MSAAKPLSLKIERLASGPIIHAQLHASIGVNIQGPSLIKVPEWVPEPLGQYYLYFADHKGAYIRLAYADDLLGPWRIHVPGSLQLGQSHFLTEAPRVDDTQRQRIEAGFAERGIEVAHDVVEEVTAPHIASPDVHVDDANQRIVMYYHGLESIARQVTRVAVSTDGLNFEAQPQVLGNTYFRTFVWQDMTYALAMPGQMYRSQGPFGPFEKGPMLFNPNMRHNAVLRRGHTLLVFWTRVGDAPEHIKVSSIDLRGDWQSWQNTTGVEVLRPEFAWEGADAEVVPSIRSTAYGKVNQLRDPAVYVQARNGAEEEVFLLYAFGGESGIALSQVRFD